MRHLNSRLLIAAVVSIGLTTVASAADLPARTWTKAPEYAAMPPCAWCGWYIGANGGGAWSGKTGDLTDFALGLDTLVAAGLTPSSLGANHGGGFGGGQFGYNWVMSNVLIGFEADIQGANIGGTSTINQSFSTRTTERRPRPLRRQATVSIGSERLGPGWASPPAACCSTAPAVLRLAVSTAQ